MIEIVATGPLATVQDLGRAGFAALGVPRSGAFDRGAARLANRLVGNDERAPLIEVTFGGLVVRAHRAVTLAVSGAPCPGVDHGCAVTVAAGTTVRLGAPRTGLRSYVAVRGGLDVDATLGSCSTDLLSGLGPSPLAPGVLLGLGAWVVGDPSGDVAPGPPSTSTLRVGAGPRVDWFADGAMEHLTGAEWVVRPESDRIGVRLDGPALARVRNGELPSEPTRPGAVQVPPDGRPIVFGPDAPVTGGYPVLAVLDAPSLDLAAQVRPGQSVRFTTPGLSRARGAGSPT